MSDAGFFATMYSMIAVATESPYLSSLFVNLMECYLVRGRQVGVLGGGTALPGEDVLCMVIS